MPSLRPSRLFDIKRQCFTTDPQNHYAILSHRWDENESSYGHVLQHLPIPPTYNDKFARFCREALVGYGCQYVWMDSVCINREDTRELQDAIRCMYSYYRHAKICIVYLADAWDRESFSTSSWFTRGWTLQELLAPSKLVFYYRDWTRVSGTPASMYNVDIQREGYNELLLAKNARSWSWIEESVVEAAGIDVSLLHHHYTPHPSEHHTVRNWAKTRVTSREEDAAYALVSLLDVCLPPLYGEGRKRALIRLRRICEKNHTPVKTPTLRHHKIQMF
ncbi:hypothetical protein ONZ45_g16305 [Pleurotus djamor]|nr:hypothetical protein ONZ45_g16305 [Pleurotus djamor]